MQRIEKSLSYLFGGVALIIAISVLYGWFTHNNFLVQVLPYAAPMQFNTALGFFFGCLGLFCVLLNAHILARIFSGITLIIGSITIIEYIFNLNLGLDELFFKHYLTTRSAYPGRMAPNTAFNFTFVGIALLFLSFARREYNVWIPSCMIAVVIGNAFVAFLGYLFNLPEAYGWLGLTDMSVHTAFSFVILGLGIWFRTLTYSESGKMDLWVNIPMGIFAFIVLMGLWRVHEILLLRKDPKIYKGGYILSVIAILFFLCCGYFLFRSLRLMRSFVEAKQAVEMSNQSKERLLRFVSHEVRNPISAIIGYSELALGHEGLPSEIRENIETIRNASYHVKNVVEDLLASSRLESGHLQLDIHEFDFSSWKEKICSLIGFDAQQRGIQFEVDVQNPPEKLLMDENKLTQIVINLCSNALKHTPREGKIRLGMFFSTTDQNERHIKITVSDHGEGLTEEDQNLIFEPFFQAKQKDKNVGIGLGLSICKTFAEMMRGSIYVDSKSGEGTTFTVELKW